MSALCNWRLYWADTNHKSICVKRLVSTPNTKFNQNSSDSMGCKICGKESERIYRNQALEFLFYVPGQGNNTFLTKNNKYRDISLSPTLFLMLYSDKWQTKMKSIHLAACPALKKTVPMIITHVFPPAHSSLLTINGHSSQSLSLAHIFPTLPLTQSSDWSVFFQISHKINTPRFANHFRTNMNQI
jgi:hypothetical protein